MNNVADTSASRRLAVIMFIDMAGFTALMGKQEAEAMRLLHICRDIQRPLIKRHNGRWLKELGDGLMCSFSTVSDAMYCALSIQLEAKKHPGLLLKMGVHLGEIIEEDGDIYGDGVNVASRIESIGVGGAILCSKKIRDEIKNLNDFRLLSLGTFEFVNVDEPLEIFTLTNDGLVVPDRKQLAGKLKQKSTLVSSTSLMILGVILVISMVLIYFVNKSGSFGQATESNNLGLVINERSIAVLPFENLTLDKDLDYFSQGVADEIRSQLATIKELTVISRASSMLFKDKLLPMAEIRESLKVKYLLGGRMWFNKDSFRIRLFLTNTESDTEVWSSNPLEGPITELISIQDQLAKQVAKELGISSELKTSMFGPAVNVDPAIYNLWLKAWSEHERYTPAGFKNARDIGSEILKRDSSFALGYYLLGDYYLMNAIWFGGVNTEEGREKSIHYFRQGLKLDPNNALCNVGLGNALLFFNYDFEQAESLFRKALDYGEPRANLALSMLNLYAGRFNDANRYLVSFMELDPFNVFSGFFRGRIMYFKGQSDEAIAVLQKGKQDYKLADYYHSLGKVYLNTDRYTLAIGVLEEGISTTGQNKPALLADMAIARFKSKEISACEEIIADLKARFNNDEFGSPAFYLGQIYAGMNDKERSIEWLEKSLEQQETELVWLKIEPQFAALRTDKKFQGLMKEIGFPL